MLILLQFRSISRVSPHARFGSSALNDYRRIEIAIQRFFAKRNLNSERKDVFDKYLAFGGVDSGPKMFSGGLDAKTLSDLTAPEIATMTAKHSVGRSFQKL